MAEFFKPRDFHGVTRNGKRERLTVSTAAVKLTKDTFYIKETDKLSAILPVRAAIQVNAQPIWFTLDGTNPSATVGFAAVANDIIYLNSYQEIQNFKAAKSGATDATIEVLYFYGR